MKKILFIMFTVVAILFLSVWYIKSNMFKIGGGGINQYAPDVIYVGESPEIRLDFSVWGEPGNVKGRYKNVTLYHKLTDSYDYNKESKYEYVAIKNPAMESRIFKLSPYLNTFGGEIEYYVEFEFDGVKTKVNGIKKISIKNN